MASLDIQYAQIRCTSVPGHQLPFGTSISEQLKKDLNNTTGLIALITKDSLLSTWVLFELGSAWSRDKLVIPIVGPGLSYENLPGPLKDYPGVLINDEYCSYRLTDAINQLADTLNIAHQNNANKDYKKDLFINQLKAWKSNQSDPDLSLQQQVEKLQQQLVEKESIIAQLKQQLSPPTVKIGIEIELKSERGVDYTKLRDLLAAGEWKEADTETLKVMLQAANRTSQGYLDAEDIDNFPCEDLRTINQLWLHYSKGKFGFSVQADNYRLLGGTREYNQEVWEKFCDRVGWRNGGSWLSYNELTFNIDAPQGHLPKCKILYLVYCLSLFSRVKTCNQ
ncbi:GUN4 domain protein [Gloeothece citriformis PCC 7424]|uniref:GUN4 domain protein n=2 Tax=Gloeothece TaxID=28070 RepID=B7KFL5_GLOC7|nr:GUN4 domain protein [Gloeothece citriformis PCC 7424]